jgi:hypothetical protein
MIHKSYINTNYDDVHLYTSKVDDDQRCCGYDPQPHGMWAKQIGERLQPSTPGAGRAPKQSHDEKRFRRTVTLSEQ